MKKSIFKPVSNLDLKLLDVKFIAIDDNQTYLTEALQSVRRTKISQLPSLLKPKNKMDKQSINDTTMIQDSSSIFCSYKKNKTTMQSINQIDQSFISNNKFRSSQFSCMDSQVIKNASMTSNSFKNNDFEQNRKSQIQKIKEEVLQRNQKLSKYRNRSLQHTKAQKQKFSDKQEEEKEVQKYRRKIARLKQQNTLIHKQISSLYRNKINHNREPLRKIRKIQPFTLAPLDINSMSMTKDVSRITKDMQSIKSSQYQQMRNSVCASSCLNMQKLFQITKKQPTNVLPHKQSLDPQIRNKLNFYQNLVDSTPYKDQLEDIHKKIISNNIHKNFSQYLLSVNKRIPQFIKKLRT